MGVFGKKSACAKNPNLILFFGKWCACATSLYLWPYVVRSTSRAAGNSAEGHVPHDQKTRIIPVRGEWAFTLAKKTVKNRRSKKTKTSEVGFLQCLGVVAYSNFRKKPVCDLKIWVFLCQCKWLFYSFCGLHVLWNLGGWIAPSSCVFPTLIMIWFSRETMELQPWENLTTYFEN